VYFAALSTNILISLLDVDSFIRSPSTTCPEAGSVVGAVAGAVIGSVSTVSRLNHFAKLTMKNDHYALITYTVRLSEAKSITSIAW
jgi:hypothetical protein